jgi:hypothetical protein
MLRVGDTLIVYYGSEPLKDMNPRYAFSDGGVALTVSPSDNSNVQSGISAMIGDRAIKVQVGGSDGVLTWADPGEDGLRPHHVIWTEYGQSFDLAGVRGSAEIVTVARSLACR